MNLPITQRLCAECGEPFTPHSANHIYDKTSCLNKAKRHRRRERETITTPGDTPQQPVADDTRYSITVQSPSLDLEQKIFDRHLNDRRLSLKPTRIIGPQDGILSRLPKGIIRIKIEDDFIIAIKLNWDLEAVCKADPSKTPREHAVNMELTDYNSF